MHPDDLFCSGPAGQPFFSAGFLSCVATAAQAYAAACAPVCRRYHVTQTALNILLFLDSNPAFNTARDVCRLCGIKSGITSVAIESLIRAGCLGRETDAQDHRIQRLTLLPGAAEITAAGHAVQKAYMQDIFRGVTPESYAAFAAVVQHVTQNIHALDAVKKDAAL